MSAPAVPTDGRRYASRAEARRLLMSAAARLARERQASPILTIDGRRVCGGTTRELAALAGLGLAWARQEVDNMRRRSELDAQGHVPGQRGNRPEVIWAPAQPVVEQPALPGAAMLDALLRSWPRAA